MELATKGWKPRYVNYARAHLRTCDEMLKIDTAAWPNDVMTGFNRWLEEKWRDFRRDNPHITPWQIQNSYIQQQFDEWLILETESEAKETAIKNRPPRPLQIP